MFQMLNQSDSVWPTQYLVGNWITDLAGVSSSPAGQVYHVTQRWNPCHQPLQHLRMSIFNMIFLFVKTHVNSYTIVLIVFFWVVFWLSQRASTWYLIAAVTNRNFLFQLLLFQVSWIPSKDANRIGRFAKGFFQGKMWWWKKSSEAVQMFVETFGWWQGFLKHFWSNLTSTNPTNPTAKWLKYQQYVPNFVGWSKTVTYIYIYAVQERTQRFPWNSANILLRQRKWRLKLKRRIGLSRRRRHTSSNGSQFEGKVFAYVDPKFEKNCTYTFSY